MRPILFALFILTAVAGTVRGQDVHFTQFYASPMLLNPGLTGAFAGQLRASAIYRDQYRGLLQNSLVTTTAALDFRFPLRPNGRENGDAAAAGIVFFNDRVREFDFSHNQIIASGAYHKLLDKATNQLLSGGLQVGIGQRNINYGSLTFEDEFEIQGDGTPGYFGTTGESLPTNNISYFDASVGLNYSYAPRNRASFYVGAAAFHLNEPDLSFYTRQEDPEVESLPLRRKYVLHGAAYLPVSSTVTVSPRALAMAQGPSLEALVGTNVRFQLDDFSSSAMHLGSWVRGVKNDDGFGTDAVVALLGFEYNNFLLGTSYDLGLSGLTAGSRGRGALEISLAYLGNYENDSLLCPQF